MNQSQPNPANPTIPVWDIWVRLFHWSLAVSVLFMLVSGETGFQFFDWHRTVGEVILALIVFRIIWGIIGSSNTKLVNLIRSPRNAVTHLLEVIRGNAEPERGHNAAGSWAVIAMLALIGTQALTGLFIADEDELLEGAFYSSASTEISEFLYSVHHTVAELIQVIVAVHVLMIFFYLFRARQNLVSPMLSGRMRWTGSTPPPAISLQHWVVGFVSALLSTGFVGWLVGWF